MSDVLVDSNVILDLLTEDQQWLEWSVGAMTQAADTGRLVINPIIYGEVAAHFSLIEELEIALSKDIFAREPIPYEAAFLAGRAFVLYRRRGGMRRSPLPDFFIGAHAAIAGYRLLTRDAARFSTYFPRLTLISP